MLQHNKVLTSLTTRKSKIPKNSDLVKFSSISWSWPGWGYDGLCTFTLSSSERVFDRLILTKHCRCFNRDTQGTHGAADLLEALSQSPLLEELLFIDCSEIPAGAWQKVRNAKWLNLKKADFSRCLAERHGQRFSCFLLVPFCLCWMLSEFGFV